MQERWYVTWRHSYQAAMEAITYMVDSKAEGEIKQAELLNVHRNNICYRCSVIAEIPSFTMLGNNDNIVTRVRPESAVYQTIYKAMGFKS